MVRGRSECAIMGRLGLRWCRRWGVDVCACGVAETTGRGLVCLRK